MIEVGLGLNKGTSCLTCSPWRTNTAMFTLTRTHWKADKGPGIFIPFLFRVMGTPAGVVTGLTKKQAKFWQVTGRLSNKIHFPIFFLIHLHWSLPPNSMKPLGTSCTLSTNQLDEGQWLSLLCPSKSVPALARQQSYCHKRSYLPQVPSQTPVSLTDASSGIKKGVYAVFHCSSANIFSMSCVWKCAHLQMGVPCQEEKLNANGRTPLLSSLLVVFVSVVFQGVNEDQLCWLLTVKVW